LKGFPYNRDVHPYLFHIGRYFQPTYGVMAALGLVVGLWVVFRLARQQALDPDKMWNLGALAILSGIVGAKLLMILVDLRHYMSHLDELFSVNTLLQSGGVFSGGLLLAIAVCWWYVHREGIPFLRAADVFAPGIAVGHALGRIGCFAAGCCYGRETHLPWAVTFTNPIANQLVGTPLNVPLHPTQLYEFVAEMANFAVLYWLVKRKRFEGQVIGLYMFLYGIERFLIEMVRGDEGRGNVFGGAMSGTQLIAIGLVICGGVLWMMRSPLRQTVAQPSH
jgi:phosphatidylglycerol---prolipoprotein diacylglyceryl transferase